MMNIIPITPATIDLIQKLNDGVRPDLGNGDNLYVYRGEGEHASIVTRTEVLESDEYPEYMSAIDIYYIGT